MKVNRKRGSCSCTWESTNMNLNQLEYFVSVAENLNFTRAAEKCYISQTAMTQQIRALEKQVGVPLFIRDKHHVALTPAGKVLQNEAYIILERTGDAMRMARLASEGASGEITIGFNRGLGNDEFAELLRGFHRTYPNIKLRLIKDNTSILLDRLESRECDIIFSIAAGRNNPELLTSRYMKSYPVMGVLYTEHPLADRQYLTYEELEHEQFIMMQPASRQKDQMEESMLIYKRGGYLPDVIAVEADQETLMLMIAAGMGISLMPEYITRQYQKSTTLKILPMLRKDGTAETIDVEVSFRTDTPNPAVEKLLGLCFA